MIFIYLIPFINIIIAQTINYKNNECLQCKQIFGDARQNIKLSDLATTKMFENFFLDECFEMQQNRVPYAIYCYELYYNHTDLIYESLLEKVTEDKICQNVQAC
uniref:Saposin B-type domain-containing protein n=1 Tax=Panagrolaimus sp. JU765 TaxID=591449 RepID=A0AC34RFC6_9BILA